MACREGRGQHEGGVMRGQHICTVWGAAHR